MSKLTVMVLNPLIRKCCEDLNSDSEMNKQRFIYHYRGGIPESYLLCLCVPDRPIEVLFIIKIVSDDKIHWALADVTVDGERLRTDGISEADFETALYEKIKEKVLGHAMAQKYLKQKMDFNHELHWHAINRLVRILEQRLGTLHAH